MPSSILTRCQQLAEQNPNIQVLWLYGSQAKGSATEHSDYDFAIAFKHIEKDSLDRRLAPILLAQRVMQTGKVLHCKSGLRLAREENRISGMWSDYLTRKDANGCCL